MKPKTAAGHVLNPLNFEHFRAFKKHGMYVVMSPQPVIYQESEICSVVIKCSGSSEEVGGA